MSGLAITGCGVLSPAGAGLDVLVAALAAGAAAGGDLAPAASGASGEPLPAPAGHALVDFDPRRYLGRKGTAFLDRGTALALVACGQALEDSGLVADAGNRRRIGVVLGTTTGSLRSMSDYTRETLVEERPYLVNPALFPNTVMNCAAGQSAIRYGLRGVNATIAGGQVAFLAALRYAANALRRGYADALLAGAVEEFTAHRAWAVRVTEPDAAGAAGEGAAVFTVERADAARRAGRHVDAEVLSVTAGFAVAGEAAPLRDCAGRALERAGVDPGEVTLVAPGAGEGGEAGAELEAAAAALGVADVRRLPLRSVLGECHAATAALQVAAVLGQHRADPGRDGRLSLVAGRTPEGGVAAAVLRGYSRAGAHCR